MLLQRSRVRMKMCATSMCSWGIGARNRRCPRPCVPKGVDAFFLIDEATRKAARPASLEIWRQQGWWVLTMLPLIQGTAEVPVVPRKLPEAGFPMSLRQG